MQLLAQTLVPLLDLGSGLSAEVLRLKHSANLDLGSPVERSALEPLDRLFHRPHLPKPEAGDQFLRFRERPVDHGPLSSEELDPHAFRARMKPLAGKHYACFHQLFVVLPHLGKEFLARKNARLRVLVSLDYHHDSHRFISSLSATWTWASRRYRPAESSLYLDVEREAPRSTGPVCFFRGIVSVNLRVRKGFWPLLSNSPG